MLEEEIIAHCAPVLANLKTACVFRFRFEEPEVLMKTIRKENQKLNQKGVFVELLKAAGKQALLYVYRPQRLEADLRKEGAGRLLQRLGYQEAGREACLERLKKRLQNAEFPHEIGLFLGYPPEDVAGFIAQGGKHYKCRGMWKVYGDEKAANQLFARFRLCSAVYKKLAASGRTIAQITIAP